MYKVDTVVKPNRATKAKAIAATVLVALLGLGAMTACEPTNPRDAVQQYWGSGADYQCVSKIIQRESRWQPTVRNSRSGAAGLFQIMWSVHGRWVRQEMGYSEQDMLRAAPNARVAKSLSEKARKQTGDRWQPWRINSKPIRGGGCPA